jgi:uncharacterized HAD superfamily protein
VDVDDVLAETTRALARLAGERFGRSVSFDAMHSFDLRVSIGLDEHEYRHFMKAAHESEFLLSLPAVVGAAEVLAHGRELGFEISVITGRPPATRGVTEEWLLAQGIVFDALEMVDKYGRHEGEAVVQRQALSERAYDLAIEDSADLACFLVEGATRSALLMDRPWNRSLSELPEAVERVTSWSEIGDRIRDAVADERQGSRRSPDRP